jgi:mono/diheme cytochrome c family protein
VKRAMFAVSAAAGLLVAGCNMDKTQPNREYSPDMVSSVPFDAFAPNPNTRDGRTLLTPPEGTIHRTQVVLHYGPGPIDAERAAKELKNPYVPSHDVLARGKVAFERWCTPCHDKRGLGQGLVTNRPEATPPVLTRFPNPPSLVADHAKGLADGQIFHIISFGQGVMPAHGSQVPAEDRWKIAHHIRTLQGGPPSVAQENTP